MIRAQLEKLMALSSRDFAHYQISLDPIKGKIPKDEKERLSKILFFAVKRKLINYEISLVI